MSRWVVIFGGDYAVSDDGCVQRLTPGKNTYPGKMLKLVHQKVGYYSVRLGGRVHKYVHDLVAECFIGPKPRGKEINHKDGVKTNNHWRNLEYVSHHGNMRHAGRRGLLPFGTMHPGAKLSAGQVKEMRRRRAAGDTRVSAMAKEFGVSPATACEVSRGRKRVRG